MKFEPKRVLIEENALEYPLGRELYTYFKDKAKDIEMRLIKSHNRVTGIPGKTPQQGFYEAKRTMVIGVRKSEKFQTCKPSAHYQLPIATSCPGKCEYCYLQTTLGKKPYIRTYVNIDEILNRAKGYILERQPEITLFEGAATSDPVPVEYLTGNLAKTIEYFGQEEYGRFRVVTKFTDIDSLLHIKHRGHTTFRFTINTPYIIDTFEHNTPSMEERILAAGKIAKANYPLGFIIGPIMYYKNWQRDYENMLKELADIIPHTEMGISFELITHRFTSRAKNSILTLYPQTKLDLNEKNRQLKYGQFGYTKYVYPKEIMNEIKGFFHKQIRSSFKKSEIKYLV
jgi:spore photoproduct lyase